MCIQKIIRYYYVSLLYGLRFFFFFAVMTFVILILRFSHTVIFSATHAHFPFVPYLRQPPSPGLSVLRSVFRE